MSRNIVICTCGTAREAHNIAQDLVRRRLAACVNIIPAASIYRWKGKIVNEREWLMIIKSSPSIFAKLRRRILALHSYELPEIVAVRIDDGFKPYLGWLDSELRV